MEHRRRRILFIFLVFFVGLAFATWYHAYYIVEDVLINGMDVYITSANEAGFNLDPDLIHFGLVPVNSPSAYRTFDYVNPYDYPLKFHITAEGEMAPWILYEYEGQTYANGLVFYLDPGEKTTVKYVLTIDPSQVTVDTHYEGELRVLIKRKYFMDSLFS